MAKGAIGENQVSYLRLLEGHGIFRNPRMPVVAKPLQGEIIALKKFLPGGIDRGGVFLVILVKLIQITDISIGYVGVLVHKIV